MKANYLSKRVLPVLISLFLAAPGVLVARPLDRGLTDDNRDAVKQKLQSKLDEWHKNASFPGATVGVTLANGDYFGVATSYSDRTKKTPMKPDDIMMAGSVGKTYVAAVALQLIKQGKFSLDDNISKYLSDEEWFNRLPNAKDIKIRNLMNHTSGRILCLSAKKLDYVLKSV